MRNIATPKVDGVDTLSGVDHSSMIDESKNLVTDTGQALGVDNRQYGRSMSIYGSNGDFYTDSGVANAYVLTAIGSKQTPTVYRDGQRARFRVGNTPTGPSTINVAGVGVVALVNNDGSALVGGEFSAGDEITVSHDISSGAFKWIATSLSTVISSLLPATQAEQEATTSNVVAVTPSVQQFHPSAAKAWINFDGTGVISIRDSYNISSIVDNGTGDYTINFTVNFSTANYAAAQFASDAPNVGTNGDLAFGGTNSLQAASSFRFRTTNDTRTAGFNDVPHIHLIFFGDQV